MSTRQRPCFRSLLVFLLWVLLSPGLLAGGLRWNGSLLQFNPRQYFGTTAAPDQWYPAYINDADAVVVKYGGSSGDQIIAGLTGTEVMEAIGSGGSSNYTVPDSAYQTTTTQAVSQYDSYRQTTTDIIRITTNFKTYQPESMWVSCDCSDYSAPDDQVGGWNLFYDLSSSYRETRHRVFNEWYGLDAYDRSWRTRAGVFAVKDRTVLNLSLLYEETWATGVLDQLDATTAGLDFTPQYYLLDQSTEYIDLAVFGTLGADHIWYDGDQPGDDECDVWRMGGGLLAGKTTPRGDLRLVYPCHPPLNADGDDMLTEERSIALQKVGLVYTAFVNKHLYGQASLFYTHIPNLPNSIDSNDVEGDFKIGFQKGGWSATLGYSQLFANDDWRTWSVYGNVGYTW